jgi:hypothetical protein
MHRCGVAGRMWGGMGGGSYLRCTHCRGFYEADRGECKWCGYDAPQLEAGGAARAFEGREDCRAIQVAEYDRLPAEAHEDCMGPPRDEPEVLCRCLHCGPDGHAFEAIEMRWMANERMWACPCTTCGGRGFNFDVHPAENRWECVACGHRYAPANGDFRSSNARCPKCGCTRANGWFDFDDEDEDEEFEDEGLDVPAGEAAGGPKWEPLDDSLPWDDDEDEVFGPRSRLPDGAEYDLGISWREVDDDGGEFDGDAEGDPFGAREDRMPDDIDFPRDLERQDRPDSPFGDDEDIRF